MARPIGGSHSHRPTQDKARKRPTAVASAARGGHSRSHTIVHHARDKARLSNASATSWALGWRWSPGLSDGRSVTWFSATRNTLICRSVTSQEADFCQ